MEHRAKFSGILRLQSQSVTESKLIKKSLWVAASAATSRDLKKRASAPDAVPNLKAYKNYLKEHS
jgi:hypothetical protein